jgi:S-ribosylhomocysteine lyase LuxS involved in autoinducer biosynthesis
MIKMAINIPQSVKVGGKIYKVIITDKLKSGTENCTAEIDYRETEIRIFSTNKQRMEADFIHELTHAILDNLGYKDQDEKEVDEMANALHAVIVDNKNIFC